MEINGKIISVLPAVTGQGKNGEWKKQEFIIQTDGQYPKNVCISLWGDKINNNIYEPGTAVTVSFDPESREYNGRWFTELRSWKVTLQNKPQNAGNSNSGVDNDPPVSFDESSSDDLPF